LQVVSAVLRESWGWNGRDGGVKPWTRPLPTRALARLTGLSTDRLKRDVDGLVERGVLFRRGDRYQVVPDPQAWKGRKDAPVRRLRTYPQDEDGGTPKQRCSPPKPPFAAAEMSSPSGSHRKRKEIIKKRLGREEELSPVPAGEERTGPGEAATGSMPAVRKAASSGS
jgi:hypothetical protein